MLNINNSNLRRIQTKKIYIILSTPLSFVFNLYTIIRNYLYKKKILSIKTLEGVCISIGNIHLGGSGKSPFLIALTKVLLKHNNKPAILTRGYQSGLKKKDFIIYKNGCIIYTNVLNAKKIIPDEALMYSKLLFNVPIIVCSQRYNAAQHLLEIISYKPTHWLLDDGFQHRKLKRHFDCVLIDGNHNINNDKVFPLGMLRENQRALSRADMILITYNNDKSKYNKLLKSIKALSTAKIKNLPYYTTWPTDSKTGKKLNLKNKSIIAICGIAEPERFFLMITKMGISIDQTITVGDHKKFSYLALKKLNKPTISILTTEKDYFRNKELFLSLKLNINIIKLEIDDKQITEIYANIAPYNN